TIVGMAPAAFRAALASALVKDEADRPIFDATFDRFFGAPAGRRSKRDRRPAADGGEGGGAGQPGSSAASRPASGRRAARPRAPTAVPAPPDWVRHPQRPGDHHAQKLARQKALLLTPFEDLSPATSDECDALVAALARRLRAHLSRRQRNVRRGRLDVRRTLRRSISTGGVPIDPAFRHRQPGRPDLVALCDCSYSVATASRFLLALLAPAAVFFRRVHLFAFVDQPVEVSFESGMLVPHSTLDLHARSDFGRVLVAFWQGWERLCTRNTVVLILGDARNNRRPPRADVLGRIRNASRRVAWLNPESAKRWDTGDSVMRSYTRHCDAVIQASNLHDLYSALKTSLERR